MCWLFHVAMLLQVHWNEPNTKVTVSELQCIICDGLQMHRVHYIFICISIKCHRLVWLSPRGVVCDGPDNFNELVLPLVEELQENESVGSGKTKFESFDPEKFKPELSRDRALNNLRVHKLFREWGVLSGVFFSSVEEHNAVIKAVAVLIQLSDKISDDEQLVRSEEVPSNEEDAEAQEATDGKVEEVSA